MDGLDALLYELMRLLVNERNRALIASSKNVVASPGIVELEGELLDVVGVINSVSTVSSDIDGVDGVAGVVGVAVVEVLEMVSSMEVGARTVVVVGIMVAGISSVSSTGLWGERGKEVKESVEKTATSIMVVSAEVMDEGDKVGGKEVVDEEAEEEVEGVWSLLNMAIVSDLSSEKPLVHNKQIKARSEDTESKCKNLEKGLKNKNMGASQ
ncbi:hypothetical protein BGX27_008412 [Mortierella sp. AM989]|nr:hypothetical protein BGX27_008412 [Mortierella sp. AM989]